MAAAGSSAAALTWMQSLKSSNDDGEEEVGGITGLMATKCPLIPTGTVPEKKFSAILQQNEVLISIVGTMSVRCTML